MSLPFSMADFVPCDRLLQKAQGLSSMILFSASLGRWTKGDGEEKPWERGWQLERFERFKSRKEPDSFSIPNLSHDGNKF